MGKNRLVEMESSLVQEEARWEKAVAEWAGVGRGSGEGGRGRKGGR